MARSEATQPQKKSRRWRSMVLSLIVILAGAMIAPLGGYLYVGIAGAQEQEAASGWQGEANPRSEYWRQVRESNEGITTASGPEAGVLMQDGGQNWRQLRNGPIAGIGGWFLPIVLLLIGAFFLIVGRNKVEKPLSGARLQRWTLAERTLHWVTAGLFILLAITGLSLLFGRAVLIPLMGPEGFAAWAGAAKLLHNLGGPFFAVCIALIIIAWIRHNIPNRTDLDWFKAGGGMTGKHASAGRMNGGEKLWFWFIATVGTAVCVSGLVLDFPNIFVERGTMQWANVIHAILAIGWIGLFFGHAYIGTLGTEGALEGMTTGTVSAEWAEQHHDLWYQEVKGSAQNPGSSTASAPTEPPEQRPSTS